MARAPAKPVDIKVVIARNVDAAKKVGTRPLIAVLPDANSWNDYGYRLYAKLLILTPDDELLLPFRFMFEGEGQTDDHLGELLDKEGDVFPIARIERNFCSLQNEAATYEDLVELLGYDAAIESLRQLRDVVLAKLEGDNQEILGLLDSSFFHLGMIRNAARHTAYRRGGRYLRPEPVATVEDAAASFTLEAHLPGFEEEVEAGFDFSPDPIFEDRCCVLIGSNGAGKTQLLNAIVTALTKPGKLSQAELDAWPRFKDDVPKISRAIILSSVPSDPYPEMIPPWQGIDYEYFAIAADAMPLGTSFLRAIIDCLRDDGASFGYGGGKEDRLALLERMLDTLGLWDYLYLPVREDSSDGFSDLIDVGGQSYVGFDQSFSERDQNHLAALVDVGKSAIVLGDNGPRQLSSGELAMAQFVVQAVASIENGSLLLLDEPETHLHPNYISNFMDLLQDVLARTRSIAIIATHSAYVLREVPRQRVNVLARDGDILFAHTPRMQTFGANIDELSQYVFNDHAVSPRFRKRLAEWGRETAEKIGIDGIVERYGEQLSPVTLALIAQAVREGSPA